jgi:two-component system sensor histidine kinase CpxA
LKYTAENSAVVVTLSVTATTLLLTITDQGPGVPEESLGKLFKPFYRVEAARDRQTGGTGIGLAIAERAIKLHSGTIVAKNCPEGGLLIEITLPLKA